MDDVAYIDPETIGGLNLFAYCNNNPVMKVDSTGHSSEWWQWIISGAELVAGFALCFVPGWQGAGATLIGTAVGSMISGYINGANGGTFTGGWLGGQAAGIVSVIPAIGTAIGTIVGSVITDYIDGGRNWNKIDWEKAMWSGVFAWGISIFPSIIGQLLVDFKIQTPFAFLMNAYNSIVAGVGSSIVNVYWRGYNEK